MNRRSFLLGAVAASCGLAVIGFAAVLLGSMAPSERAKANAPSFSLSSLATETFSEIIPENQPGRLFVYRGKADDLTIFWFGHDARPEQYYAFAPWTPCTEITKNGTQLDCMYNGEIQVSWGLSGQPSKQWFPVLEPVKYSVSNGTVRYGAGA